MFSILVSELTPEILAKAEYWRIFSIAPNGYAWADVRNREQLAIGLTDDPTCPLMDTAEHSVYHESSRCFPVTLSPDGTEVRLECPQMPDEVEIEELRDAQVIHRPTLDVLGSWVFCAAMIDDIRDIAVFAPTPEHYPRRTCDGVWVWSTRR